MNEIITSNDTYKLRQLFTQLENIVDIPNIIKNQNKLFNDLFTPIYVEIDSFSNNNFFDNKIKEYLL